MKYRPKTHVAIVTGDPRNIEMLEAFKDSISVGIFVNFGDSIDNMSTAEEACKVHGIDLKVVDVDTAKVSQGTKGKRKSKKPDAPKVDEPVAVIAVDAPLRLETQVLEASKVADEMGNGTVLSSYTHEAFIDRPDFTIQHIALLQKRIMETTESKVQVSFPYLNSRPASLDRMLKEFLIEE